jgi:hypothetical protein
MNNRDPKKNRTNLMWLFVGVVLFAIGLDLIGFATPEVLGVMMLIAGAVIAVVAAILLSADE